MAFVKQVFALRLKELHEQFGETGEQFAKRIGIMYATLRGYEREKNRLPNADILEKICRASNVSADWLLGLSDVRSPSADLKAVCDYTGLSESAVQAIAEEKDPQIIAWINYLLNGLGEIKAKTFRTTRGGNQ